MVYFSAYIPFYAWIVAPLFILLKKEAKWEWGESQQEAFKLAKEVLTGSPVRAYAIPGLGYHIYSDACDVGIAAILQQVQPIKIRDLKGTRMYDQLLKAYQEGLSIANLFMAIPKEEDPQEEANWTQTSRTHL